jgi:POTRA domain, FtsQ-type
LTQLLPWPPLRKLLYSIAASVVAAVLTAFTAFFVSYLLFPVTGIEVQSARMFPESEAWEAVPKHASLPFLNSEALERQTASNPWVKGAKVLKDWESGIVTVEVEERRAILDADLGDRQVVLAEDGTELPGLGGADLERVGLDEVQLEEILRVGEVLNENGVVLDSIDGAGAGGVEATVEGRHVLFADGLEDGQARALTDLMEEYAEASYYDLRPPSRVVIGAEPGREAESRPRSSEG